MTLPAKGPIYYRIAADLAARIMRGDIREGQRLSGRSMLVGSYGVSSETIRRALNLLSEQGIVEVVPGSGVRVISRQKAIAYVERAGMVSDLRSLREEVNGLLDEKSRLDSRLREALERIFDLSERLKNREPIRGYDFELPRGSPIVAKTLGELRMREKTGATLIAIKRGETLIVSPGPKQEFMEEDVLVVAAEAEDIPRFKQFLSTGLGSVEEEA